MIRLSKRQTYIAETVHVPFVYDNLFCSLYGLYTSMVLLAPFLACTN